MLNNEKSYSTLPYLTLKIKKFDKTKCPQFIIFNQYDQDMDILEKDVYYRSLTFKGHGAMWKP